MRYGWLIFCILVFIAGCDTSSSLTDAEGRPFELWPVGDAAKLKVLIFTRTDCPISNRYAPTVRSLCDNYQNQGVDFLLVYVDPAESPTSIKNHLDEYQYVCTGVHDPMHELVKLTGATVTPEAVVFDSRREMVYQGRIDDRFADFGQTRSEPTTHDLTDALDALLAGKKVARPKTKAVGCYIGDLE